MKWSLAALALVAAVGCSAQSSSPACPAFDSATERNSAFRFLPEAAGRPGGYGRVSSSATAQIPVDPKSIAGKTGRATNAIKDPCCSFELVLEDCQRVYVHFPTGVFTLKESLENGYDMFPITGPKPPRPAN